MRAAEIDLAVTYRFGDGQAVDDGLASVELARDPFVLALPEPAIAFEPGDLWTGRGIIAPGLAVGLMPQLSFSIPYPGVAIRPVAGASPLRTILAVHVPNRRVPAVAPMLACLAEAFAMA